MRKIYKNTRKKKPSKKIQSTKDGQWRKKNQIIEEGFILSEN